MSNVVINRLPDGRYQMMVDGAESVHADVQGALEELARLEAAKNE